MPYEQNHSSNCLSKTSDLLVIGFWSGFQYQARIPSCGVVVQSKQEVVGCPHSRLPTIVSVDPTFLVGW